MAGLQFTRPDRRLFSVGGCLAAGLLIVAYMSIQLSALVSPAPPRATPEVLAVRGSLRKLAEATAERPLISGEITALDRLLIGGGPVTVVAAGGDGDMVGTGEEQVFIPPRLDGILEVRNADGRARYLALLDGKTVGLRGTVNGYRVEKIGPKGIVLLRDGREWPLAAPQGAMTVRPY